MTAWRSLGKQVLGRIPFAAEAYQRWLVPGQTPAGGYGLERLSERLPDWIEAVAEARTRPSAPADADVSDLAANQSTARSPSMRLLVFGYLQWWLEYAVALALLLRAEGHRVDLAFLPHRRWQTNPLRFDLRRQRSLLLQALSPLKAELGLLALRPGVGRIPAELTASLEQQSRLDVQYTLQREQIDWQADHGATDLLTLRRRRNLNLGRAAYGLLRRKDYDAVVIPNGSILEFGALYRVATQLGVLPVTYEFGERRQHLWLAQDAEVMRLPTQELWRARGDRPLTADQRERLETLMRARRSGRSWDSFSRRWQRSMSAGAQAAAADLGIDPERPVALLCTNVVGDSLALDRQVFTEGMSEWLVETVRLIAGRERLQLIVRVHPGEMLGAGHPSVELVRSALPDLPEWVKVIPPESRVNTYDLIELAQLGLVYTTTVGLEMAMHGVPVIVAGDTHYRSKGFTHDPRSVTEYRALLEGWPDQGTLGELSPEQVELAWRYAYRFFFDYPLPFPWHLLHFWEDLAQRPLEAVVQPEGRRPYARTLRALAGEPIDWGEAAGQARREETARLEPEAMSR